jgi:hypothetical protein
MAKIKGNSYLYMYESFREGDKVRKRFVSYLGPERVINGG